MRVRILLRPASIEHRGEIGAAAEPGLRRHHEAGVHVDGRHVRIPRMGDQRDAGGPETRVLIGAWNLAAKFRRELAVHGRDVNADFLEHAARASSTWSPPPPGLPLWSRRSQGLRSNRPGDVSSAGRGAGHLVLDGLESRADPVPQSREPRRARRSAGGLSGLLRRRSSSVLRKSKGGKAPVCRSASPKIMAAVTATLSERNPARMGMISRASAASCTSSGTPADSRPTRMTSSARKAKSA